jgi:hypothetical protein
MVSSRNCNILIFRTLFSFFIIIHRQKIVLRGDLDKNEINMINQYLELMEMGRNRNTFFICKVKLDKLIMTTFSALKPVSYLAIGVFF